MTTATPPLITTTAAAAAPQKSVIMKAAQKHLLRQSHSRSAVIAATKVEEGRGQLHRAAAVIVDDIAVNIGQECLPIVVWISEV